MFFKFFFQFEKKKMGTVIIQSPKDLYSDISLAPLKILHKQIIRYKAIEIQKFSSLEE